MSAAPPRSGGGRVDAPDSPSRAPLGIAIVVAAIGISLGIQALMAGARQPALVLLGIGFVASAVAGALGWRLMHEPPPPPRRGRR